MAKYRNETLLLRALYQCKELQDGTQPSEKPLDTYQAFIFKPILYNFLKIKKI